VIRQVDTHWGEISDLHPSTFGRNSNRSPTTRKVSVVVVSDSCRRSPRHCCCRCCWLLLLLSWRHHWWYHRRRWPPPRHRDHCMTKTGAGVVVDRQDLEWFNKNCKLHHVKLISSLKFLPIQNGQRYQNKGLSSVTKNKT